MTFQAFICRRVSAFEKVNTKIEPLPKPSSKRIENAALASFFGRLWGGVHDPVHLKRPFTMEHLSIFNDLFQWSTD